MRAAALALAIFSFLISWLVTRLMRSLSVRFSFMDKPGGRKIHPNSKPLGGGVGIFWGLAIPILIGLGWISLRSTPPDFLRSSRWLAPEVSQQLGAYWSGARLQTPLALKMLLAAAAMHVLGLWDDRKAMGPYLKLVIQLAIIASLVIGADLRILTVLDHWPGGRLLSLLITILWIGAITNAFNFLDNMDGLSAGVAAVCTAAFLFAALSIGQWFVAAALALLLGAALGFLWHNFPPAGIFMGDSGSLLLGLVLGVLTVRTTYLQPGQSWANGWYSIFAPVIVLALPLYDLIVVSALRIRRGKSPFVGDTNHFSHRLVARGMTRRTAVLCLYLVTAATSVAAILLPHVSGDYAPLILLQTVLILCLVALLEQHPLPAPAGQNLP